MEDNFADVVSKAQRGLGFSNAELAARTGISEEELVRVKEETYNAMALRKLAPVLGLSARALTALPQYRPAAVEMERLAVCSSPYGGMYVNAYIIWDAPGGHAAVFDTGADCEAILSILRAQKLSLCGIFITHTHSDHIAVLGELQQKNGARVFVSSREPLSGAELLEPGQEIACGGLRIEPRLTWGHTRGGMSYIVRGLERPIVAVGDALFAGSMGGGSFSYTDALRTNREELFTLPPETIICPGHGPLTTIAEERVHNPFFA